MSQFLFWVASLKQYC